MAYTTLISTEILSEHLEDAAWVVVDCRFNLADPAQGRLDYVQAHIPGAVYADLDHDLSAPRSSRASPDGTRCRAIEQAVAACVASESATTRRSWPTMTGVA